jgi:hypothetical protein
MDLFRYTCFAGNRQMSRKVMRKSTVYLPLMLRTFLTQIAQNGVKSLSRYVVKSYCLLKDFLLSTFILCLPFAQANQCRVKGKKIFLCDLCFLSLFCDPPPIQFMSLKPTIICESFSAIPPLKADSSKKNTRYL